LDFFCPYPVSINTSNTRWNTISAWLFQLQISSSSIKKIFHSRIFRNRRRRNEKITIKVASSSHLRRIIYSWKREKNNKRGNSTSLFLELRWLIFVFVWVLLTFFFSSLCSFLLFFYLLFFSSTQLQTSTTTMFMMFQVETFLFFVIISLNV
jgi:hypothetical protein